MWAIKSKIMRLRKNQRADLEGKRKIFLEIGFFVALLLVLAAFKYPSYKSNSIDLKTIDREWIDDDYVPVIVEKQQPSPPPAPTTVIKTVDNNTSDLVDDVVIDIGIDPDEAIPEYVPVKKDDEEVPDDIGFVPFPQQKPEFPGGMKAFYAYLGYNLDYPEKARKLGITGTVYVEFGIDEKGAVFNVVIKRGIGGGCDEEVIRVLQNCPAWRPAKQQARPVCYKMTIPIDFNLNKN